MLGTSIAPAGTTNWISDPAHDIILTFAQGTGNYNRQFTVPCTVQPGVYDLLTAVWYDKDNNNLINQGDFVVSSKLTPGALSISPIGIQPISNEIPKYYKLYQNYPNPFNPSTMIKFDIPTANLILSGEKGLNITLKVYDINGREVKELVNEYLSPGIYEIEFDGSNYSSGIYFYMIQAADFIDTKRMIIVK